MNLVAIIFALMPLFFCPLSWSHYAKGNDEAGDACLLVGGIFAVLGYASCLIADMIAGRWGDVPADAGWTAFMAFLLWLTFRKPGSRQRAAKLIGDKARMIRARLVRAMRSRHQPVPSPA